jgi:hypothetical protein
VSCEVVNGGPGSDSNPASARAHDHVAGHA